MKYSQTCVLRPPSFRCFVNWRSLSTWKQCFFILLPNFVHTLCNGLKSWKGFWLSKELKKVSSSPAILNCRDLEIFLPGLEIFSILLNTQILHWKSFKLLFLVILTTFLIIETYIAATKPEQISLTGTWSPKGWETLMYKI